MVDNSFGYSLERGSSSENLDTLRSVADDEEYDFGILNTYNGGVKAYRMDDSVEGDISTVLYDPEQDSYAMIDGDLSDEERIALDDGETSLDEMAFWSRE